MRYSLWVLKVRAHVPRVDKWPAKASKSRQIQTSGAKLGVEKEKACREAAMLSSDFPFASR